MKRKIIKLEGWILEKKIKRLTLALETIIDFSRCGISTEENVLQVCKKALDEIKEIVK